MENQEFKYHNISDLENMMINILEEGSQNVWEEIEKEKNAFNRCYKRKLYHFAINKIQKGK